jgi:AraC-like DNA-binding protein
MLRDDVLLEWYRYQPGPPTHLPKHAHAEYQLNLNFDQPCGITYRGAYHAIGPDQLTIVMPGEPHEPLDPAERDTPSLHFTLYVQTSLLEAIAGRPTPTFRDLAIADRSTVQGFAHAHRAARDAATTLDHELRLLTLFTALVERHAHGRPRAAGSTHLPHRAVLRAREYLHDNYADNVTLRELADISGLSAFRLGRLFSASVGVPPHKYQLQLRVEQAKRLLLKGKPVNDVAFAVGFFDLSHFSRHFKRYVGVAPGRYASGKNVHA